MSVKPIPDGYHTITPYIMVNDALSFIDFLKKAFNAEEMHTSLTKEGKVMHAEMKLGDSMIMLSEAGEQNPATSANYYLYVNDVDSTYKQALAAGATSIMEPADQFYGDRNGGVRDQFGINWWIGTHVEDVKPEDMQKREEEYKHKK